MYYVSPLSGAPSKTQIAAFEKKYLSLRIESCGKSAIFF